MNERHFLIPGSLIKIESHAAMHATLAKVAVENRVVVIFVVERAQVTKITARAFPARRRSLPSLPMYRARREQKRWRQVRTSRTCQMCSMSALSVNSLMDGAPGFFFSTSITCLCKIDGILSSCLLRTPPSASPCLRAAASDSAHCGPPFFLIFSIQHRGQCLRARLAGTEEYP